MTSLMTNSHAMTALQTLRGVGDNLDTIRQNIASGRIIQSGKDNAAYFQISQSLKGDTAAYASINEGLTLTLNAIATSRFGAETMVNLAYAFVEKVAFAQNVGERHADIHRDLDDIVKQMEHNLIQATFNGDDFIGAGGTNGTAAVLNLDGTFASRSGNSQKIGSDVDAITRKVVTGISRATGSYSITTIDVEEIDMRKLVNDYRAITDHFSTGVTDPAGGQAYLSGILATSQSLVVDSVNVATRIGHSEKSVEKQREFLNNLVTSIDSGIGHMVEANLEDQAMRLQAMQVQHQLATQALSIAHSVPKNVLTLFS